MSVMVFRTSLGMSTYVSVVISPATMTTPVVTSVSQATRPRMGSSARIASRTASEIWSASLSGCPSVTDSDVNRCRRLIVRGLYGGEGLGQPIADGCGQFPLRPFALRFVVTVAHEDQRAIGVGIEPRSRLPHLIDHDRI